jgi:hypothetical protein
LSDACGSCQCGKLTSIDRADQQLSLLGQATLIGGGEFVARSRRFSSRRPTPK